jgi:hypothetical protein
MYLHVSVEWCTNTVSGHNGITVRLYCTINNLSVSVSVVICYLHNSPTCNILTLCYKMSVGHICNVVLGTLENNCTEWVSTCFFSIKQTISTSCLVYLEFIFIILFYFTYCTILICWSCQLCANVRWQNCVGLWLSMEFALCYISGSRIWRYLIEIWYIVAYMIRIKNVFRKCKKSKLSHTVWKSVNEIYSHLIWS